MLIVPAWLGNLHFGPWDLLSALKMGDCPHRNHQFCYFRRSPLISQFPVFGDCWGPPCHMHTVLLEESGLNLTLSRSSRTRSFRPCLGGPWPHTPAHSGTSDGGQS